MIRTTTDRIHELLYNVLDKQNCFNISCFIRIESVDITHCTYTYDKNNYQIGGNCDIKINATVYSFFNNYEIEIFYFTKNKRTSDLLESYLQPGVVCIVQGTLSVRPEESLPISIYGPKFSHVPKDLYHIAKQWFWTYCYQHEKQ